MRRTKCNCEVKGEGKKEDNHDNFVDLVLQIGLLSKDIIDSNCYSGVLGVHNVGNFISNDQVFVI